MDKGTKNYRDMMKRMDKEDPAIINPERPAGMMGGTPADLIKTKPEETAMGRMGAGSREAFNMMKTLDPRNVVREGEIPMSVEVDGRTEMMKPSEIQMMQLERMMSGMSMEDRQAIEALTTMGISLEDAMEAVMGTVPENMVEGAMGGGALQALPMQRPTMRPESFGADTTRSMDMQKERMDT